MNPEEREPVFWNKIRQGFYTVQGEVSVPQANNGEMKILMFRQNIPKWLIIVLFATLITIPIMISVSPVRADNPAPAIWTDRYYYDQGWTVKIYGYPFTPSSTIPIQIDTPDGISTLSATTDSTGFFETSYVVPSNTSYVYTITATDPTGGAATTTFDDAPPAPLCIGTVTLSTTPPTHPISQTVAPGGTGTYTLTVVRGTCTGGFTADLTFSWSGSGPSGATPAFNPTSLSFLTTDVPDTSKTSTLTITTLATTPTGNNVFTATATCSGIACGIRDSDSASGKFLVEVVTSIATTIEDQSNNPVTSVTAGTSVHDTSTLSGETTSPGAGGTVDYNRYSSTGCSGTPAFTETVTVTGGVVPPSSTFTPSASISYQAVYSGDAHNQGSTSACENLDVNPAAPTTYSITVTTSGLPNTVTFDVISTISPQSCNPGCTSQPGGTTVTVTFLQSDTPTVSTTALVNDGAGIRYSRTTSPQSISSANNGQTFTFAYVTQYEVFFDASSNVKSDGGTAAIIQVNGADKTAADLPFGVWVTSGDSVSYSYYSPISSASTSGKRYSWDSTTGLGQTLISNSFAVSGTGTVTGDYVVQWKVTFDSSANAKSDGTGNVVRVDSTDVLVASLLYDVWVNDGNSVTYAFYTPVSSSVAGKQYRWDTTGGTLGQTSQSNTFTVSGTGTIVGDYATQWLQTFDASSDVKGDGSGTIVSVTIGTNSPVPCSAADLPPSTNCQFWVDENTQVSFSYSSPVSSAADSAGTRYRWDSTTSSGSASGQTGRTGSYTVTSPSSVTGVYVTQYLVQYAATGCVLSVTVPPDEWVYSGGSATGTFPAQVTDTGTRCNFISDNRPSSITAPTTITGTYQTQYLLTVSVNPGAVGVSNVQGIPTGIGFPTPVSPNGADCTPVSPASTISCWYNSGSTVNLDAGAASGYTFWYWSGDGTSPSLYPDRRIVTMDAAHTATANYATFTTQVGMTDSSFNPINSMDVVFTSCNTSNPQSCTLTATNPGTYYYKLTLTNTGATSTFTIQVLFGPAFLLKGAQPVQIGDSMPTTPVQYSTVSGGITVLLSVNGGQTVTLWVHLDYAPKGTTITCTSATCPAGTNSLQNNYVVAYSFQTSITLGSPPPANVNPPSLVATGKKVTAIGGFVTDVNGVPKGGLTVTINKPASLGGGVITATTAYLDGFYFVQVPACSGTCYTVTVTGSTGTTYGPKAAQVPQDAYVQVNFNNLNPADPAIQGTVTDNSGNVVAGVTVQLIGSNGKILATTKTNLGGYYIFRFSQPGTYTVKILLPSGYSAQTTSVNVTIKQFQTLTVNFNVNKS